MILGGFTRICVNIHHPALAASFRDVARLKRTEQGRVALGVTPQRSGKEVTSPPPPPLRTARESFPSCSSSLSNALRRTRLSHIYLLAVDLLMAVRMHQHAVLDRIFAPMGSPHDMVVVPPRHRGDLLVANRTDTALLLPEQPQSPSARQGPGHLHAETFLEVRFPGGVVRIRFPFDLGMSLDRHT